MKHVLLLLALIFSAHSFAIEADGKIMDVEAFEEMMSVETKSAQMNPWMSSSTSCYAVTRCPNGRVISCQVYGYNYANVPAHLNNSCSWAVWPGRAVRCQGYTQVRDYYGRYMWSYMDIPVSCY
jgi:hypothetical protein